MPNIQKAHTEDDQKKIWIHSYFIKAQILSTLIEEGIVKKSAGKGNAGEFSGTAVLK